VQSLLGEAMPTVPVGTVAYTTKELFDEKSANSLQDQFCKDF